MVFSETSFLFFYLPIVLLVYYITPLRARNGVLLVVNLVFYGWGEPVYLLLMLFTILVNYLGGLLIERLPRWKRTTLISTVTVNLGLLFFFKYWGFFASFLPFLPNWIISLPIGISFYTFQAMSYTIDVYRGDTAAQHSAVKFTTYVTLFPQLIAGPIVRYKDLADQLDERSYSMQQFSSGVQHFIVGLCKKVLLANQLGQLWDFYSALPTDEMTLLGAWLGILAFTLQIYFDFSGYSDMAIGLGRMLGFEFLPNFNYPYISKSITEFWRRWHMSLGTWFRDYLYIPLGGNRVNKLRLCLNLLVVWTLTGLWHGAAWNFVLWGVYFGVLLIIEKLFLGRILEKLPSIATHIYTLLLVIISWVLFAVEDVPAIGRYLVAMFSLVNGVATHDIYHLSSYGLVFIVAIFASMPAAKQLFLRLPLRLRQPLSFVLMLLGLLLSTAFIVDASYNPFLYFRF